MNRDNHPETPERSMVARASAAPEARLALPEGNPDDAALRDLIRHWLVPSLVEAFFDSRDAKSHSEKRTTGSSCGG